MAKDKSITGSDEQATRQRLLNAAGEVFAERGFRGATVKEICDGARANIAAINYHFGDKESLYAEVLQYAHACARDMSELEALQHSPLAPSAKLSQFVQGMIHSMFDAGRPAWQGRLMAREMIEPTSALDQVVAGDIRPKFNVLRSIVAQLLKLPVEDERVRWHAASVIAQCLFWEQNRAVIQRLYPDLTFTGDDIQRMSVQVTEFSLHGLLGIARSLRRSALKTRKPGSLNPPRPRTR